MKVSISMLKVGPLERCIDLATWGGGVEVEDSPDPPPVPVTLGALKASPVPPAPPPVPFIPGAPKATLVSTISPPAAAGQKVLTILTDGRRRTGPSLVPQTMYRIPFVVSRWRDASGPCEPARDPGRRPP